MPRLANTQGGDLLARLDGSAYRLAQWRAVIRLRNNLARDQLTFVCRAKFNWEGAMTDDVPPPPFIYEGAEKIEDVKSPAAGVSDTVKATAHRLSDAYDTARKPGMPLSILSNIAREAPLVSLLVAFLLGVAVARRR